MWYHLTCKDEIMRVINLASGSKGNCSFISAGSTKLLVDAGLTLVEIERRLDIIKEKPEEIDAILITHEHIDHIKGFVTFLKKYKARGYVHKTVFDAIRKEIPDSIIDKVSIIEEYSFSINEIRVIPFSLPHDSVFCLGYVFEYMSKKVAFVTDLGYLPTTARDLLYGCQLVYIESNHDKKMLMACKYPYIVKKRIGGDNGHLSNEQASQIILDLARRGTKYFVLSHISENSNTIEMAYLTTARVLEDSGFVLEKDVYLRYSRQDRPGNNFYFGEENE